MADIIIIIRHTLRLVSLAGTNFSGLKGLICIWAPGIIFSDFEKQVFVILLKPRTFCAPEYGAVHNFVCAMCISARSDMRGTHLCIRVLLLAGKNLAKRLPFAKLKLNTCN